MADSIILLTTPSWPGGNDTLLAGGPPVTLTGGNPPGGNYSGEGVSSNAFYPGATPPGNYVISYYLPDDSCPASRNFLVLSPLGITEPALNNEVYLYPNPVYDQLIIRSDLFVQNREPLILDMLGQKVEIPYIIQVNEYILNTKLLAPGIYCLSFNIKGENVSKKFIKLD